MSIFDHYSFLPSDELVLVTELIFFFHIRNFISSLLNRGMLLGKTVGLLQLYIQPFLQGYPSFNNFPAIYNASSAISLRLVRDLAPLLTAQPDDNLDNLDNLVESLPHYLENGAVLVKEFGNANFGNDSETRMMTHFITGSSVVTH